MQLRRLLKEKMARGHVEVTLSLERSSTETFSLNRELVGGYIAAFRAAAAEFSLAAEPDLNAVLRIPGALDSANDSADGELRSQSLAKVGEALDRLNQMREEEGRGIARELRERMAHCRGRQERATAPPRRAAELQRAPAVPPAGVAGRDRRQGTRAAGGRPAGRSQRHSGRNRPPRNPRATFPRIARKGGEIGKKLDFLLQEMNREANTLLSKTSGLAGEALKITEAGLAMKAEIEKSREQVQNLE